MLTLQGVRRLSAFADLTFGVRWNHLDGRIDFKPPVEMEVERTRDWVDPVIGVVLRTSGDLRWHATLIADVGGFGLGSNLTWQVLPTIGFDLSSWSSFELGYRLISTDYDTGAGSQRFEYDILYQGPVAGFAFSF
jgi:hypothetical protein